MGQPVRIVSTRLVRDGVVRFELDRSLTGTSHETFEAAPTGGERPTDVLARRLFASGAIRAVHVHSNIVTIDLEPGRTLADTQRFEPILQRLYIHYLPGVKPTPV